jgi:hypothetical protein
MAVGCPSPESWRALKKFRHFMGSKEDKSFSQRPFETGVVITRTKLLSSWVRYLAQINTLSKQYDLS